MICEAARDGGRFRLAGALGGDPARQALGLQGTPALAVGEAPMPGATDLATPPGSSWPRRAAGSAEPAAAAGQGGDRRARCGANCWLGGPSGCRSWRRPVSARAPRRRTRWWWRCAPPWAMTGLRPTSSCAAAGRKRRWPLHRRRRGAHRPARGAPPPAAPRGAAPAARDAAGARGGAAARRAARSGGRAALRAGPADALRAGRGVLELAAGRPRRRTGLASPARLAAAEGRAAGADRGAAARRTAARRHRSGGRRRQDARHSVGRSGRRPSRRREVWRRRGLAAAAIGCCGLAVAAAALPFALQSFALAAADRHIEALRPRVAEAEALRRRIAESKGGQDAFAAERARVGDALRAVAALTEILPDDTWLTELTLRQRKLTIAGRSAGAARLIGLLSSDPTIRDAAFAAPVTRAEGGGGDAFSIRAELGM